MAEKTTSKTPAGGREQSFKKKGGNLYEDAAAVMNEVGKKGTSGGLRSIIYNNTKCQSDPRQMYALVSSTLKYKELLAAIVKASGLLKMERKWFSKNPNLALVMAHDLVLSKSGRLTAKKSQAKDAILRHKTRLKAELVKYKVKHKIQDVSVLVTEKDETPVRWVRINEILADVKEVEEWLFSTYKQVSDWRQVEHGCVYKDENVAYLYGIHPSIPVSQLKYYKSGHLIIQDRASCFPATILHSVIDNLSNILPLQDANEDSTVRLIDACSAPGNKTTHLAALSGARKSLSYSQCHRIHAFERDPRRAGILTKMLKTAGADVAVEVHQGDFTQSNPADYPDVLGLIVDPSCSGSGIFGRGFFEEERSPTKSNKDSNSEEADDEEEEAREIAERLDKLAGFQYKIVKHAMRFTGARALVYSTCSIHGAENEKVVERLLLDSEVQAQGWRVAPKEKVLPRWSRRGIVNELGNTWTESKALEIAEGCVRAAPKEDGGIGFFAVCFVRDQEDVDREKAKPNKNLGKKKSSKQDKEENFDGNESNNEEEEWGGFDD